MRALEPLSCQNWKWSFGWYNWFLLCPIHKQIVFTIALLESPIKFAYHRKFHNVKFECSHQERQEVKQQKLHQINMIFSTTKKEKSLLLHNYMWLTHCDRLGFASTFYTSRFLPFFFFLPAFVDFGGQILLLWTVYALFTYCAYTVHVLKNIKNGSHGTIYTFKNYFATVFSVFSFQFSVSATISSIQMDPKSNDYPK